MRRAKLAQRLVLARTGGGELRGLAFGVLRVRSIFARKTARTACCDSSCPAALRERRGLRVEVGPLPVEALRFSTKPFLFGCGKPDRFLPLGRIALQLLQPHFHFARAIRDGSLLFLNRACSAFEADQIVLKL